MIKSILDGIAPLWGVCAFDEVKDNLHECRSKSRLPEGAESVIVFAFPYLLPDEYYKELNISKYAVVPDYHKIIIPKLEEGCRRLSEAFPGKKFSPFADSSPIPEVYAACKAGLGVKGRNSLLITEKYGSFVFLGEIVTDLDIEKNAHTVSLCIGCGKCVEACPAGAISDGGVDREKCLSDISQRKGCLTEEQSGLIKKSGCAWGCDICQNICPYNINAAVTDIPEFISGAVSKVTGDVQVEGRAFAWRGEKVINRNLLILADRNGE